MSGEIENHPWQGDFQFTLPIRCRKSCFWTSSCPQDSYRCAATTSIESIDCICCEYTNRPCHTHETQASKNVTTSVPNGNDFFFGIPSFIQCVCVILTYTLDISYAMDTFQNFNLICRLIHLWPSLSVEPISNCNFRSWRKPHSTSIDSHNSNANGLRNFAVCVCVRVASTAKRD